MGLMIDMWEKRRRGVERGRGEGRRVAFGQEMLETGLVGVFRQSDEHEPKKKQN